MKRVLLLHFVLFFGFSLVWYSCTSSNNHIGLNKSYKSHTREAWLLQASVNDKVSLKEQTKKDNQLGEYEVPHFLKQDPKTMREAKAIWRDTCSACHGMTGKSIKLKNSDVQSRNFGTMGMSMGFLFGGDKMRAGIFRKISQGSNANRTDLMPSYNQKLSRQQIWGLVFFIESL